MPLPALPPKQTQRRTRRGQTHLARGLSYGKHITCRKFWASQRGPHVLDIEQPSPSIAWRVGVALPFEGSWIPLVLGPVQAASRLEKQGQCLWLYPRRKIKGANHVLLRRQTLSAYRSAARVAFSRRLAQYAPLLDLPDIPEFKVKAQRSRWGSCSSQGGLNFNWRLILAPPLALDYVVAHELCHLREFNHSPQFWRLVADMMPGYERQKDWLHQHGNQLFVLDKHAENSVP